MTRRPFYKFAMMAAAMGAGVSSMPFEDTEPEPAPEKTADDFYRIELAKAKRAKKAAARAEMRRKSRGNENDVNLRK